MSKDDFDIFRHLRRDQGNNAALDLIQGLEDRHFGHFRKNVKAKENIEMFAEEELVRKKDFAEMRCEMPGLPRSTFLMVFSSDGTRVASTHGNHNIYVTDIRSGKNIKTLIGHPRTPWCIAFHPTSDQIVASGCLGGQVRIWDLSGGSEVWTAGSQSVIASIAFHPNDRVLVIATYNEVYFWDWSQPEPFVHASTSNPKEKVRYVAFDKLGHKLITGIANSPQTRWERVRAPVPVPRQERCASPYRRRITQRLVNMASSQHTPGSEHVSNREPLSSGPERERRITVCYRNLVREYEQLVQRYLQLYRPPTMIDRGTDPMEPNPWINNSGTHTIEPSNSRNGAVVNSAAGPSKAEPVACSPEQPPQVSSGVASSPNSNEVGAEPSTSGTSMDSSQTTQSSTHNLLTPSRIFSVIKKPNTLIRATQTPESRKHKADEVSSDPLREKRFKKSSKGSPKSSSSSSLNAGKLKREEESSSSRDTEKCGDTAADTASQQQSETGTQTQNSRRLLFINLQKLKAPTDAVPSTSGTSSDQPSTSGCRFRRPNREEPTDPLGRLLLQEDSSAPSSVSPNSSNRRSSLSQNSVDELLTNIRRTAEEEVRNRILPIIRSVPANDRPELIRLFENSREHVRMRFRQMYPIFLKKSNRRPLDVADSTSESSSSDDDQSSPSSNRLVRRNSEPTSNTNNSSIQNICANNVSSSNIVSNSNPNVSQSSSGGNSSSVRNFNTELEQLVTSLLTEIERNETENPASVTNNNHTVPTTVDSNTNSTVTDSVNTPSVTSCLRPRPTPNRHIMNLPYPDQRPLPGCPPMRNPLLGHLFQEFIQLQNLTRETPTSSSPPPVTAPSVTPAPTVNTNNTNTRTTNSTIYTTSNGIPRRRFFSHRVSAFMPTRVNYTRTPTRLRRSTHHVWGRGRLGSRIYGPAPFALDELINYSERENSEDDPPQPQWNIHPFDSPEFASTNSDNTSIGNIYSNIVQDLESSLNDVRNIRASNRPSETSDMLSSLSERLENIMNQSDTILRNLSSSMEMLTGVSDGGSHRSPGAEPSWSFYDQGFYVRDQRTDNVNSGGAGNETINLSDLFSSRPHFSAIAADHTYPRNPDGGQASPQNDNMSPLMTSLHLTISHIQRQARLLRQQVDSVERIDRANLEVAQLQLLRQLIIELVRHIRSLTGERPGTGMSSVRQMMAGTRISDSSPYDSPSEETNTQNSQPTTSRDNPSTSEHSNSAPTRSRGSNRKTYPPSRLFRLARQCRRSSIVHFFSRRYMNRNERGVRPNYQGRSANSRPSQEPSNTVRNPFFSNYSIINSSTLSLMTRRLEHLLTDQMRIFARPQETPQNNRSTATIDLGEHILALRLQGCVLRMIRVLGLESSTFQDVRMDPSAAVTQDGVARYGARHTLSLIVDGMSRHMEELDGSNLSQTMRLQIHGVLAMSLLLTELLLLIAVDSIPEPSAMQFTQGDPTTTRIDEICGQMLQTRHSVYSHQLSRSLRLMRLTMRQACRALGTTYAHRRRAMLPRHDTDRRQLLGSINRCLRTINRRRQSTNPGQEPSGETNTENSNGTNQTTSNNSSPNGEWYNVVSDLITQYSTVNQEDEPNNQPSTSARDRAPPQRDAVSSNNDNSEDNDDEPEWYGNNNSSSHNSNLYRTNNVNLVQSMESPSTPPRWNVPSVQVNDVPVSEPSIFGQRLMSQRQRFAERMSELRSNPTLGLFRPRFLHPLYASVNPFDADLDDPQREQINDSDMITTVTPNHRIQAWDISNWKIPVISNSLKNIVVSECKIHNDASVDVAKDGTILVTLLPSGGYLNVTNRLGVYSLRWETLGQCLYTTSFEQNAVSVSLSPLSRHLVVGLASRRVSIVPSDRWVMARIFKIDQKDVPGDRLPILRELEHNRDSRINCIRWLPCSGQGLIYATNTGQLVVLS